MNVQSTCRYAQCGCACVSLVCLCLSMSMSMSMSVDVLQLELWAESRDQPHTANLVWLLVRMRKGART
ncbi:uncharacterized protein YALI1_D26082g [Yarrowia lipolytica]|uniref:Uncharacterized protein n=1 Tax=Yarrowia lipolytica TaxID=4952 RepID=A0A1D8NFG5_YARLL|nr:hypothetical protein YALI1_D26082g [Yarrowia lipolytica]